MGMPPVSDSESLGRGCAVSPGPGHAEAVLAATLRRAGDIGIAGTALVATVPLMAVAAVAVRLMSTGPVFVAEPRSGRGGDTFRLYRLRTEGTTVADDLDSFPLQLRHGADHPVTRFVRRSGVDRLPRLWNVVRGDMAMVGPRPETPSRVVACYGDTDRQTLSVRPGLTGAGTLYHVAHCAPLLTDGRSGQFYENRMLPVRIAVDRVGLSRRGLLYDAGLMIRAIGTMIGRAAGRRTFREPREMAAARRLLRAEGRVIVVKTQPDQPTAALRQAA